MSRLRSRICLYFQSLAGRLAVVLTIGIALASLLSLLVAERARQHDFAHVRFERVAASTLDVAERLRRDPGRTSEQLAGNKILGARAAPGSWRMTAIDPDLSRLLNARLGDNADAEAMQMPRSACFPNFDPSLIAAGTSPFTLPDCWYVRFRDAGGITRRLSIDLPPVHFPVSSTLDPLYVMLIVIASLLLSLIVARASLAPLRLLAQAARTFSVTADAEPVPERGPSEVRAALATFNMMQQRVREGFRERTQLLASITHDIQTPLTRLRLRLEQVTDEALRARLIADLAATQKLVRAGLELARSSESQEAWAIIEIDSVLSSLAEDATELDADVRVVAQCDARARVKPDMFARCLTNLIDNAVKYGTRARIGSRLDGDDVVISVEDDGNGVPEALIPAMFEPYRRNALDDPAHPPGSGLGLSIARAQAQGCGAVLAIRNGDMGGLVATIRMKRAI